MIKLEKLPPPRDGDQTPSSDMSLAHDLLNIVIPSDLRLFPDGKSVIYSIKPRWQATEHPISSLWVAKTASSKSARQLSHGSNDRMGQPSPNGQFVAFISDRGSPGESCAIYHMALDGGEPQPITPAGNLKTISKFGFSPDGKQIAYISPSEKEKNEVVNVWGEDPEYANLRLIDVDYGSIRVVFDKKAHVVDFCWNPNGHEIAIITDESPDPESSFLHGSTISIIDVTDGSTRTICHVPDETHNLTWVDSNIYFTTYSTASNLNSSQSVYVVDSYSADGVFEKVAHGEVDCAAGLTRVGDEVLVYALHGMEDHLRILNGKVLYRENKLILGYDALIRNGEISLVIAQGTMNHPPEIFAISPDGCKIQLSDHGKAFADTDLGRVKFIECQSLDNKERLEGMYIVPSQLLDSEEKPMHPLPTLVLPHGGPYWRVVDSFNPMDSHFIPRLLAEGYGLLLPNYRGGSGRGDRFARYAGRGLGAIGISDIVALTQLAIDRNYADPSRLTIFGHSQGGFFSYLSAVRNGLHGHGWRFRAAIPSSGVADCDTMTMTSDIGYEQGVISGSTPWTSDKSDTSTRTDSAIWEFKEAAAAGRIPPMLILHGMEDRRVPIEQAQGFRRALVQAGLEFEFAAYVGEDHAFQKRKTAEDMMERIVRFVKRHMGEV